jgi:hypothetical protein
MSYPVEVRGVYDLQIYPVTVMPGDYTNLTVLSIIDPDSARLIADIDALHVAAFPSLPSGASPDPNTYDYLKVRLNNGIVTVLSLAWINQSTITPRTNVKIYAVIDQAQTSDVERVREALTQNGFQYIAVGLTPSVVNSL